MNRNEIILKDNKIIYYLSRRIQLELIKFYIAAENSERAAANSVYTYYTGCPIISAQYFNHA